LLNRAEDLKNSNNWREATEEMNELMTEWKKIGHIPREYGDELWEKFIAARHHFFNRKDSDRDKRKARFQNQLDSRLQQTEQFLEKIKEELADEESKLSEFAESLKNTTGEGHKEEELRKHLENLIQQIERKLPARREKVEEVAKQLEELQQKRGEATQENTAS
jgi:chromosome segregation ATPase